MVVVEMGHEEMGGLTAVRRQRPACMGQARSRIEQQGFVAGGDFHGNGVAAESRILRARHRQAAARSPEFDSKSASAHAFLLPIWEPACPQAAPVRFQSVTPTPKKVRRFPWFHFVTMLAKLFRGGESFRRLAKGILPDMSEKNPKAPGFAD